jgi:hypothetical protein
MEIARILLNKKRSENVHERFYHDDLAGQLNRINKIAS